MIKFLNGFSGWQPLLEEDGAAGGGGSEPSTDQPDSKTYTAEEMSAEIDRRVTAALKKAERKSEEKVREAEKLAKMDADEKYRYELEQREKQIAEKEQALALAENKAECSKILASKGISTEMVDFVVDVDADTMQANINLLDRTFKESVRAEVEKRLASESPKGGNGYADGMTKERFREMSLPDQQQLYSQNPELYKQMTQKG